jgi:monoamine oxidase
MKQKECVVIGAGLAGLAAACRLTRNDCKVAVLEARDRPRVRLLTRHFLKALRLNCELGSKMDSRWKVSDVDGSSGLQQ